METLHRECQRWKFRCKQTQIPSMPSLETTLLALPEDLYPKVARCFHLLLLLQISTASAMRRLKTYLRSTVTTERLSGLGFMDVQRDREMNANSC
ncbi:hypothetical protein DPMN_168401 [Dreissena polymorpha]|uniref:Uncharacterized protein n=1 Tax=Dreissena polymorpha TaxID=45954 RepID=A0A9D4IX72_DREPO|nr:hypothetical protein DPMN_168401 [Dreissena polymorpha]